MSKLKVILIASGAVVVAGYVWRKPLVATGSRYADYAHGFVNDIMEEAKQRRYNEAVKRHQHGEYFRVENPETGEKHTLPVVD